MSSSVQISVVIPCLNEEEAVGAVVDQAWEGIRSSGREGEVIVVDNASSDRSAEVAAEHGARVVTEPRRGYGSAYLAGLADARGEYVVMGDADETYPIQELGPFVDRLEQGDDLVLGSRFKGTIHGDAMPWLNRRIGNPILTGLLNLFFGVKVSDAHCGMRAVRRDALRTLDLHSTGMEFASEMVFKAYRRGLSVSEIPIDYFPRVGESKLNRFGDAWRHARFMLVYSPSWLYFLPGAILLLLGLVGALVLATRPRRHLRPDLGDPHDARLHRGDARRRAGRPARALRPDVCARPPERARPASRPAARADSGSSTASSLGFGLILAGARDRRNHLRRVGSERLRHARPRVTRRRSASRCSGSASRSCSARSSSAS